MKKPLMLLSMAFGLSIATSALAERVHVHTSSSVHVTSKNGETNVEASYSENGSSVHISTNGNDDESITLSLPSTDQTVRVHSDADDEDEKDQISSVKKSKKAHTSISIRSSLQKKLSQFSQRREMRLARRICWRFGDDTEQCLDDALEGVGSSVRLRLRDWISKLTF